MCELRVHHILRPHIYSRGLYVSIILNFIDWRMLYNIDHIHSFPTILAFQDTLVFYLVLARYCAYKGMCFHRVYSLTRKVNTWLRNYNREFICSTAKGTSSSKPEHTLISMTEKHMQSGVLTRAKICTLIDTILSIYQDDLYGVVKSNFNIEILFMGKSKALKNFGRPTYFYF